MFKWCFSYLDLILRLNFKYIIFLNFNKWLKSVQRKIILELLCNKKKKVKKICLLAISPPFVNHIFICKVQFIPNNPNGQPNNFNLQINPKSWPNLKVGDILEIRSSNQSSSAAQCANQHSSLNRSSSNF